MIEFKIWMHFLTAIIDFATTIPIRTTNFNRKSQLDQDISQNFCSNLNRTLHLGQLFRFEIET